MKNRVIVLSGIPGSGKSTVAERYRYAFDALVVSADHYFIDKNTGDYAFDPEMLAQAHGLCLRSFVAGLEARCPVIVVDNTNTTVVEVAPYMALAAAYGYDAVLLTMIASPVEAQARNVHGVKLGAVERMARNIVTRRCPPWWKLAVADSPYEVLP